MANNLTVDAVVSAERVRSNCETDNEQSDAVQTILAISSGKNKLQEVKTAFLDWYSSENAGSKGRMVCLNWKAVQEWWKSQRWVDTMNMPSQYMFGKWWKAFCCYVPYSREERNAAVVWRDGIIRTGQKKRISQKQLVEWWKAQKYLSPCPSVQMVRRWRGNGCMPVRLKALEIRGSTQQASAAEEQLLSQLRLALPNQDVQFLGHGGGYSAVIARLGCTVLKVSAGADPDMCRCALARETKSYQLLQEAGHGPAISVRTVPFFDGSCLGLVRIGDSLRTVLSLETANCDLTTLMFSISERFRDALKSDPLATLPLDKTWAALTSCFGGTVRCVSILHHKGLAHRDLKPGNFLLRAVEAPSPHSVNVIVDGRAYEMFVADFGTSTWSGAVFAAGGPHERWATSRISERMAPRGTPTAGTGRARSTLGAAGALRNQPGGTLTVGISEGLVSQILGTNRVLPLLGRGTRGYNAPESGDLDRAREYCHAAHQGADCYSLGAILADVLSGGQILYKEREAGERMLHGASATLFKSAGVDVSETVWRSLIAPFVRGKHAEWPVWRGHLRWKPALDLLAGLLHYENSGRLDAKSALDHAFFASRT